MFGPGVEQSGSLGVFPNGVNKIVRSDSINDPLPGLPGVARLPDVRSPISHLVALGRDKGGCSVVRRGFDQADPRVGSHVRWRDVDPIGPAVAGDVNETIV